jgi:hypothetical protein
MELRMVKLCACVAAVISLYRQYTSINANAARNSTENFSVLAILNLLFNNGLNIS